MKKWSFFLAAGLLLFIAIGQPFVSDDTGPPGKATIEQKDVTVIDQMEAVTIELRAEHAVIIEQKEEAKVSDLEQTVIPVFVSADERQERWRYRNSPEETVKKDIDGAYKPPLRL